MISSNSHSPPRGDRLAQGRNIDELTVAGFGDEWNAFDQKRLQDDELRRHFEAYFSIFPFEALPPDAEGFDLGCGSGRWATLIAPLVGILHCIDPSAQALDVARSNMRDHPNTRFHLAASEEIPLEDSSQDFGYSLGVLHHIPDTELAMRDCVAKLKPGAPFLVYLYYNFDNRPGWFRILWKGTDVLRRAISKLPFPVRKGITSSLAALIYWPLARIAGLLAKVGVPIASFPLSTYRNASFYTMRTDALDRFGTRLERRFSRAEIEAMMGRCGLAQITFSDGPPHWVACGIKA